MSTEVQYHQYVELLGDPSHVRSSRTCLSAVRDQPQRTCSAIVFRVDEYKTLVIERKSRLYVLRLRVFFDVLDTGIDVTANQDDELTDKETFQIEFEKEQWRVRTADNQCWKVADASGIQATDNGRLVL